ncbi:hypothetical protein WMF18_17100 [Sorangium sp. So ce315]|uniref:hypothetical protein n=1 Tax=Sorangium sp. So ce315 TaxID=3133299 RepID=UPI003F5EE625
MFTRLTPILFRIYIAFSGLPDEQRREAQLAVEVIDFIIKESLTAKRDESRVRKARRGHRP